LGRVASEKYLGRIVVEVFDTGGKIALLGIGKEYIPRAIAALQQTGALPHETTVWPSEPIMGHQLPDQTYRG